MEFLKYRIAVQLSKEVPYRFQDELRPLLKGLHEKKEIF